MVLFEEKSNYKIDDLLEIMRILRSPEGCPWDREQTHTTIKKNIIEEAYEAADAIGQNDDEALCEELGDVLLQIIFHAQMAKETGEFDFDKVCDGICRKLILRHPHVFGEVKADTAEKVLDNWAEIKKAEKGQADTTDVMNAVARSLPALMRGQKIAKAAIKGEILQPTQRQSGAEDKISALIWEAVRTAVTEKLDAEEVFTDFLNDFISRGREEE
ncbi:MAG TPA: MazG family protein [Oscillospiraceae bacterium]|nr:MazG family protein [Oscillospiraceae bacterium]HPS33846.1 MazG family protein [Oscillospiraceae bacterium]